MLKPNTANCVSKSDVNHDYFVNKTNVRWLWRTVAHGNR